MTINEIQEKCRTCEFLYITSKICGYCKDFSKYEPIKEAKFDNETNTVYLPPNQYKDMEIYEKEAFSL